MNRAFGTAVALLFTAWLIAVWCCAWLVFRHLDAHVGLLHSDEGQFVYWTTLKAACWVFPALAFLRMDDDDLRTVLLGAEGVGTPLAWGLGAGVVFAVGCVLGFVAQRSGSVGASIVAHALNNLFA